MFGKLPSGISIIRIFEKVLVVVYFKRNSNLLETITHRIYYEKQIGKKNSIRKN